MRDQCEGIENVGQTQQATIQAQPLRFVLSNAAALPLLVLPGQKQ